MPGSLNKILLIIFLLLFIVFGRSSSAQNSHYVIFYNVENLFDYFEDSLTNDESFTPTGKYHWTKERFYEKIRGISKTIIAGCEGNFPDIIGLAEIENKWVLEQLISKTPFKEASYNIIHKESPDTRGIDVALLYREGRIIPVDLDFIAVSSKGKHAFQSRDILYFKCRMDGVNLHFYINHWPSRSEGYLESKEKRISTAKILKSSIDTLRSKEINPRILIMGDFNTTPKDGCMKILETGIRQNITNKSLVNLSEKWIKNKEGTIYKAGQWEVFDQFICSGNLIEGDTLFIKSSDSRICHLPFLLEKDNKYLGTKPLRTYLGPIYHGGISDHLPIVTIITGK